MPGVYIHVPFCDGKCPYCDFYSLGKAWDDNLLDAYTRAAAERITGWAAEDGPLSADTVYFGGGTPSVLGAPRLAALLGAVAKRFVLSADAEITLEANPTHLAPDFFPALRAAGFNRVSLGLQSALPEELALLGRSHSPEDAARAVEQARAAGFANLSLDLMLGLPGGSGEKLLRSVDFAASLAPEHLSAYILKVEPGTPFARQGLSLPEDDETADQYLLLVDALARRGYAQYEISNFARPGRESRHNLVYWHGEEYLGFGPGAHSFWRGRRFYQPRDLRGFLDGASTVDDGPGGRFSEYAMLNLRLTEGLRRSRCIRRFGDEGARAFARMTENAARCPRGLVSAGEDALRLSPQGFLVSNALILRLLEGISDQ